MQELTKLLVNVYGESKIVYNNKRELKIVFQLPFLINIVIVNK